MDQEIHITSVDDLTGDLITRDGRGYFPHLFLTPDNLITGDLEQAATLRLYFHNLIYQLSKTEEFWDNSNSAMNTSFDRFYRNWKDLANHHKRIERFLAQLKRRSEQVSSDQV